MRQLVVSLFSIVWVTSAFAQQTSSDPALGVCQQLLGNANAQTIQIGAQAQSLAKQLEDAKAELAKLKDQDKKQ